MIKAGKGMALSSRESSFTCLTDGGKILTFLSLRAATLIILPLVYSFFNVLILHLLGFSYLWVCVNNSPLEKVFLLNFAEFSKGVLMLLEC